MKKILSLLCAAAIVLGCLGSMPVLADGDEAPAPDDLFVLGDSSEYGELAIVSYDEEEAAAEAEDSTPLLFSLWQYLTGSSLASSYDPRDSGALTAVRSQGNFEICWAMAAIAAAEMDGLTNGLLATSVSSTNLSEFHLIYFLSHKTTDPLGNATGDYNTSMSFWLNNGGNPVIAAMTLASWHGAASESDTNSAYSRISTSALISSSYAYTDVLHLENTYAVDISTSAGRTALKEMITEHGGAVLCLYYNSSYLFAGSPSAQDGLALDGDAEDTDESAQEDDTAVETAEPVLDDAAEADNAAQEDDATEAGDATEDDTTEDDATEAGDAAQDDGAEETDDAQDAGTGEEDESSQDAAEEDALTQNGEAAEAEAQTDGTAEDGDAGIGLDGTADAESVITADLDGTASDYTVCYYQNTYTTTNHEVLIVGWDDDYPKENFGYSSSGAIPEGDGAWLCRNSYGDSWAGGDGYFWVSYYDKSIISGGTSIGARATVFEFDASDNYDNLYEYDGAAVLGYVNDAISGTGVSTLDGSSSSQRWYANVFTANANADGAELLKAVSTYTYAAGVSYTAKVYTGLSDLSDPTSGTLAATVSGEFTYAGFHTVELDSAVTLSYGQTYAIVFEVSAADDGSIFIPACYTSSSWKSVNDSASGQSFVSINGSAWYDCYTLTNQPNVRIKAYTVNTDAVSATTPSADDFPFEDVSTSSWYYEYVLGVWQNGLMEGMSSTVFQPTGSTTRAQAITVLYRLAGEPDSDYTTTFDDVKTTWYYSAICWAQGVGLAQGSDDDKDGVYSFRPNDSITRQEFVLLLYRYAAMAGTDVSGSASLSSFSDSSSVSSWALTAEQWSVAIGIQQGSAVSNSTALYLLPTNSITRAEMAAMLLRFSDLI